MVQPAVSASLFYDLFAPLPEQTEKRKDPFDHIADYAETSEGAWDIFRFGNHIFSAIESTLPSSHVFMDLVSKVKGVFDSAGAAIGIPRLFSNINALRRSIARLFTSQDLPDGDPLKTRRIAQAAKGSFVDSLNLTNTVVQIALFLNSARVLLFEAVHLRLLDGIYNLTGGISDTVELIGEGFKLRYYHSPEAQPRNVAEGVKLSEKKTLAWMTIAKDVVSIAMAAIALCPLVAAAAGYTLVTTALISSPVMLGLSGFWLVMKVSSYFYNKLVVEVPVTP